MVTDQEYRPTPTRPAASRAASTSLFLGMVAIVSSAVIVGGLVGIAAIVLGRRATRAIHEAEGRLPGLAMARTGVILGWMAILLSLAALAFWVFTPANHAARDRQRIALTINHMRAIVQACQVYADDYDGTFPPHLAAAMTGYGIVPDMLRDARSAALPMTLPAGAADGQIDWHAFAPDVDAHCDFTYAGDHMREKNFASPQALILYAKKPVGNHWLVAGADGSVQEVDNAEFRRLLQQTNDARKKRGLKPIE